MADYTDVAAVRLALSPGGDDTDLGTAASLDDADLQAAIDDATDEINGKIATRYQLPLSPVPTILNRIARDIAAYFATLTFRRGDPLVANDPVQLRYNAAEALLTQIQNGTLTLDSTDPNAEAELSPMFVDPTQQRTSLFGVPDHPLEYPSVGSFGGGVVFVP